MTGKAVTAIAIGVFVILLLCSGMVGAVLGGAGAGMPGCGLAITGAPVGQTPSPAVTPAGAMASGPPHVAGYTDEQLANATTIVTVGRRKNIPPRGWVIAVATARQESTLHNLPGGDRDSVGLFQQRPSQGWGTPAQLQDPTYAAGTFYDALTRIDGWQQMPLTDAAQAVQKSAYPDAYAAWESDATAIVAAVGSGNSSAIPENLDHCLSICPAILSNATVDLHLASGDVDLTCSDATLRSAEQAPRNPDGSWPEEGCTIRPDPTTGNGCVTPRLLHLVQQADAAGFPKPGCYRIDDHGEHPKGRACDWMVTSGGEASGTQKALGNAMAAWAVANAARLGIMYVIWFRMIWTQDEGWHAYNNPWGGEGPSGWHTNHVHVSVH